MHERVYFAKNVHSLASMNYIIYSGKFSRILNFAVFADQNLSFWREVDGWTTTFITIYTIVLNHLLPMAEMLGEMGCGG